MAKAGIALAVFLICIHCLSGSIVINEAFCQASGNGSDNAWIELYNNGGTDTDLTGSKVQTAGATFATVFTFPHFVLRPGRYVLIGESNVTLAAFTAKLNLVDGNTSTAGIRFVSADGTYTDTVLYGSPNPHNLTDDNGSAGNSFAPAFTTGMSVARKADGYDTNLCSDDFWAEPLPTPGLSNPIYRDYGLQNTSLTLNDDLYKLETDIYNYAVADEDTASLALDISLEGEIKHHLDIQPVSAGHSVHLSIPLAVPDNATGTLTASLNLVRDAVPANNIWMVELGQPVLSEPRLNELLYNPGTGNQEWVELSLPPTPAGSSLILSDLAGNQCHFKLPDASPQYLLLCENPSLLFSRYSDCPPENVLQVTSLPALNNEGDVLILKTDNGISLDSLVYFGNASYRDVSLEREVDADSTVTWHYCYNAIGGTPGQPNSTPPPPSALQPDRVKVLGSPFNPAAGEKMHLQYNFNGSGNSISCNVYDLYGKKLHELTSSYRASQSGEIVWNGCDKSGKPLSRGIYILLVEAKNSSGRYILRKQLTVVLATK